MLPRRQPRMLVGPAVLVTALALGACAPDQTSSETSASYNQKLWIGAGQVP